MIEGVNKADIFCIEKKPSFKSASVSMIFIEVNL